MPLSDVIVLLGRATILFLAGLIALWLCRKSTPAVRHLVCLASIAGSLGIPFAMLLPEPTVLLHVALARGSSQAVQPTSAGLPWTAIALVMWGCGCAFVIFRFLTGCFLLGRVKRSATAVAPQIYLADVSVPMLTGLLRPAVLLPRTAGDWPESQRDAAIRHELAHLERGDLRANALSTVACAVYWFHPLVWLVSRRLRIEQESACDDVVIESGFDRVEYAEALVSTARGLRRALLPSCPMAGEATEVKARVARVLARPAPSRAIGPKFVLAGLTLALMAAAAVGAERIYTNPSVVSKTDPQYTAEAKAAKTQGTVLLSLTVGVDGAPHDIAVVSGIDAGLNQSAVQSVQAWRFRPGTRDGKPIARRVRIAVNFRLL